MTILNTAELAKLTRLDQVIMWAIASINKANLDPQNTYISDNAGIRAESADYIQWSVTRDDKGSGKFVFTALLPLVGINPFIDRSSLLAKIHSYSPFPATLGVASGIVGYGVAKPIFPTWIDTTERLLAYVAILATKIGKYARATKNTPSYWANIHTEYWADCQYTISQAGSSGQMSISGQMWIDWDKYEAGQSLIKCLNPPISRASAVSCNFPDLAQLWSVAPALIDLSKPAFEIAAIIPSTGENFDGEDLSAESLIDSYYQSTYLERETPQWYLDALSGAGGIGSYTTTVSGSIGNATPQIIESLEICKEQDPELANFGRKPLEQVISK
jgi:hypothetical protein